MIVVGSITELSRTCGAQSPGSQFWIVEGIQHGSKSKQDNIVCLRWQMMATQGAQMEHDDQQEYFQRLFQDLSLICIFGS